MKRLSALKILTRGGILLVIAGIFPVAAAPDPPSVALDRITTNLMCVCGCPHQIKHCGDECGEAPLLIADIQQRLENGDSEAEIYASYEARYGPQVHAAPKTEGFSLLAWVLPFVALAAGGIIVLAAVRKLKPAIETRASASSREPIDEAGRRRLEREMTE